MKATTSLMLPILCLIVLLTAAGCHQPFDPKGPHDEKMVVFSILATNKGAQFVRVYSTYDPPGLSPLQHTADNFLPEATVSLSSAFGTTFLRDTLLPRQDTSRYHSKISAFVAYPFRVEYGKSYGLTVSSRLGSTAATITLPQQASFTYTAISYLDDPIRARGGVTIRTAFSRLTAGYWFRMLLSSEVHRGGAVVVEEDTIPSYIVRDTTLGRILRYYPKLEKAAGITATMVIDREAYIQTLRDVVARNQGATLTFKNVTIEFTQLEEHLYKYYSIINGFADPRSIRTDVPDYSNLPNAHGIFGGYTVDSLVHILPEDFPFNQN